MKQFAVVGLLFGLGACGGIAAPTALDPIAIPVVVHGDTKRRPECKAPACIAIPLPKDTCPSCVYPRYNP